MQRRIAEVLKKYSFNFPVITRRYDKEPGENHNKTKQTTVQPTKTPIKPVKQNNPLLFHTTLLS